jgi:hypothetical protein
MRYITPIYDRAESDIENRTSKAFFNVTDWARIHNNTQVAQLLVEALLSIDITSNTVTPPTMTTIPTVTQLNEFLENIETLRLASALPEITGLVAIKYDWIAGRMAGTPDYLVVNDWERVLDIVYNAIARSVEYAIYCGVGAVGQPRFYQHRFRRYGWVQPSDTPSRHARAGVATCGTGLTRNNSYRRYD